MQAWRQVLQDRIQWPLIDTRQAVKAEIGAHVVLLVEHRIGYGVTQVMLVEFSEPCGIDVCWIARIKIDWTPRGQPASHQRGVDPAGRVLDRLEMLHGIVDENDIVHRDTSRRDPSVATCHALMAHDQGNVASGPCFESVNGINFVCGNDAAFKGVGMHFGFPASSMGHAHVCDDGYPPLPNSSQKSR